MPRYVNRDQFGELLSTPPLTRCFFAKDLYRKFLIQIVSFGEYQIREGAGGWWKRFWSGTASRAIPNGRNPFRSSCRILRFVNQISEKPQFQKL
jgi:hypothetical protein